MSVLTHDISLCAAALQRGELVAFGTETVYGLGANSLNPQAVARIFEAKGRPTFDPLIVHLADAAQVTEIAECDDLRIQRLMQRFWPGPLTILLPRKPCIPDLVTSGLPDVGVRIPNHLQARELIRAAGVPVAAPSANLFGRISPTTAAHVADQLGDRIDYILDCGPSSVGVESTVVRWSAEGVLTVLRPGGTTLEELRTVADHVEIAGSLLDEHRPIAPGQLAQHYAPSTGLHIVDDWHAVEPTPAAAALCFRDLPESPERFAHIEVLTPSGSLTEAAANFFAALRKLDAAGHSLILAERFPDQGLGVALNDRLRRAAHR